MVLEKRWDVCFREILFFRTFTRLRAVRGRGIIQYGCNGTGTCVASDNADQFCCRCASAVFAVGWKLRLEISGRDFAE